VLQAQSSDLWLMNLDISINWSPRPLNTREKSGKTNQRTATKRALFTFSPSTNPPEKQQPNKSHDLIRGKREKCQRQPCSKAKIVEVKVLVVACHMPHCHIAERVVQQHPELGPVLGLQANSPRAIKHFIAHHVRS